MSCSAGKSPFRVSALLFIAFICISVRSLGQPAIQVGWNTTSYRLIRNGSHETRSLLWGINTGIMYRLGGKRLCVQPTMLFTQKGAVNNNLGSVYTPNIDHWTNKLGYAELSLPVILKLPIMRKSSFDIGIGPYAGSLVSAVSKAKDLDGKITKTKFKVGSDSTDDFKRMDAGLCFYFGGKFSHFNMSLVYEKGLVNISPAKNESIKNGCFSFNIGVFLF